MELIIFFTNRNKLGVVGVRFPNTLNDTNKNQYYLYQFSADRAVWVVNDQIDDTSMENLLNTQTRVSSIYFVYHNLPTDAVKTTIKKYCTDNSVSLIPQNDKHEYGKSKLYHLVGEFCQPNAELKVEFFDDLKSKFNYDEELEKKLTLLHDCLHHDGAKAALKEGISWLSDKEKAIVETLARQTDNLSKDYIAKLTELRISLLGS